MQRPVGTAVGEHEGAAVQVRHLRPGPRPDPGARERFDRAAVALAAVRSPDLAAVLHAGDGVCARVLVTGVNLRAVVSHAGDRALPLPVTVAVLSAVARAASALHRAGIAHDALTPENVILSREGRVVITDAGLSAAALGLAPPPPQAAPERIAGGPPSPAADVFALGRLLQLLLGDGKHPAALERLVRLALEPDPARRPGSLDGLIEALQSAARASGEAEFVPDLAAFVIAAGGDEAGGGRDLLRTARPVSPGGARSAALAAAPSPVVTRPPEETPLELATTLPPRPPPAIASAAYLDAPARARARIPWRTVIAAAALLGLAAGGAWLARRPEVAAILRSPGRGGAVASLVIVDSVPPGADVYLDGELAGQTPLGVGRQAIPGVPLEIRVEKRGYRTEVRHATMAERVELEVRLQRR